MQLVVIDHQIERIAALLAKYNYSSQEKELKLAYLRGYVSALLDAELISKNEYQAFIYQIAAL